MSLQRKALVTSALPTICKVGNCTALMLSMHHIQNPNDDMCNRSMLTRQSAARKIKRGVCHSQYLQQKWGQQPKRGLTIGQRERALLLFAYAWLDNADVDVPAQHPDRLSLPSFVEETQAHHPVIVGSIPQNSPAAGADKHLKSV